MVKVAGVEAEAEAVVKKKQVVGWCRWLSRQSSRKVTLLQDKEAKSMAEAVQV